MILEFVFLACHEMFFVELLILIFFCTFLCCHFLLLPVFLKISVELLILIISVRIFMVPLFFIAAGFLEKFCIFWVALSVLYGFFFNVPFFRTVW